MVLKAAVRMRATILRNKLGEARVDSDLTFHLLLLQTKPLFVFRLPGVRPAAKSIYGNLIPRW